MQKIVFSSFTLFLLCIGIGYAQLPGDTLTTATLSYGSLTRDTVVQFPDIPGITYEKILMLYNMRCKDGLISPPVSGQTNLGCGEWDYSCNTYITDSTKIDSTKAKHPSHIITGFSGTTYSYTTSPTYTFYQYTQQDVTNTSTISETMVTMGAGTASSDAPFATQHSTAKSQYLWTASELATAGFVAGDISGVKLNISNAGSQVNFLKIRMKHSTQAVLDAAMPELGGFTEVYFLNTSLVNGVNEFQFYNNFTWNGTDNILVEFSFSNPTTGTANTVLSDNLPTVMGLVSSGDDYNFEFMGANRIDLGNGNFSNFTDQISISFWNYGNVAALPANTSAMYASNPQNHRQVNLHLPWSDGSIYWDCGSGGQYDRINKAATATQYEGQWNHWVFTKNSSTGIMQIYLNGLLWHSGTGKTLPIQITDFMLGGNPNMGNVYFGQMDEVSIWNTVLTQATIQEFMYQSISPAHPNYTNLIAHYNFNEGTGTMCNDLSSAAATANITGASLFRLLKGKDIFKGFIETTNRPVVTFIQGTYVQTITPIIVMDSIQNNTNTVNSFAVVNNAIVPTGTNTYFQAGNSNIYDGDTGGLLGTVNYPATGSITITQLDYFLKSPSHFQIMSFVTPYGINLDLGMTGKTWTFDVTDYAPFLKGRKRLFMNAGGEWQEDMDIQFQFIVGTPPRNVRDIRNIWKVESAGYTAILNNDKFEPRTVPLDPNAVAYKIKTAITGHGQEGEFIPRTHQLNINGGTAEYSWQVWKACGENPVYPQGGTWIYDRAGWCPGMATDVKESDITQYVSPGDSPTIDYTVTTASGASNYWVSNQLVSYGPPNFSLDIAIVDVKNPSNKVEYARSNSMCNNPTVVIRNTGSTGLTSAEIEYWVNNSTTHRTFTWYGFLGFLEQVEVKLPVDLAFWVGANATNNIFHAEIRKPNNGTDEYPLNNKYHSPFNITSVLPSDFVLWVKTNNAGAETRYKVLDSNGATILNRTGLANNTNYKDTLHLGLGCYSILFTDTDNDGIDFWANNDGIGTAKIFQTNGTLIKGFEGDFGKSLLYNFTVQYPLSFEDLNETRQVLVYPNPAQKELTIEGKYLENNTIRVFNAIGQQASVTSVYDNGKIMVNTSALVSGVYALVIHDAEGKTFTQQIVIE